MAQRRHVWKIFLAGLVLGAGALACASYVAGLTDQRPFCATCHIMDPQAVTHKLSTHLNVNCNECHLPNGNFLTHYAYKAYTGVNDVAINTLGSPVLPVHATTGMKDIINANCRRCHTGVNQNVDSMSAKPYCSDCHRNVPHLRAKPISTRMVAYE